MIYLKNFCYLMVSCASIMYMTSLMDDQEDELFYQMRMDLRELESDVMYLRQQTIKNNWTND